MRATGTPRRSTCSQEVGNELMDKASRSGASPVVWYGMTSMIRRLDPPALREAFRTAQPFPSVCIDGFLEPEFAREVSRSYPSPDALVGGRTFNAVNERRKTQIVDPALFPAPVARLAE